MTIVECLVAILVLVMGFLAVASCYPLSYREATFDKNRIEALSLAHDILNQVRSIPYGQQMSSKLTTPVSQTDIIEGRTQKVVFYPSIAFLRGSDHSREDTSHSTDICVVTVQWQESGYGAPGNGGSPMPTSGGGGSSRAPRQVQVVGGVGHEY
jgi:hypothetical protein